MPATPTPRRGLLGPDVAESVEENVYTRPQAWLADLDDAPRYSQGPIDDRPAAGVLGRHFYATDIGLEFVDHATAWAPIGIPISGYVEVATATDLCDELVVPDGRELSRAAHAELFALIGTTHGVGNGTTTFNIPDTCGRGTIGDGAGSGLTARTIGAKIGSETHALTPAQTALRDHTHEKWPFLVNGQTGGVTGDGRVVAGGVNAAGVAPSGFDGTVQGGQQNGTAHPNMQPSIVVRRLIRIL